LNPHRDFAFLDHAPFLASLEETTWSRILLIGAWREGWDGTATDHIVVLKAECFNRAGDVAVLVEAYIAVVGGGAFPGGYGFDEAEAGDGDEEDGEDGLHGFGWW
jgi:hypothetical protein